MGDVGCLVDPAARLPGGGADIPQGCPDTRGPVVGGQGGFTFRARLTSGRFDNVWAQRTHRRRHASACPAAANDNRTPLARAA